MSDPSDVTAGDALTCPFCGGAPHLGETLREAGVGLAFTYFCRSCAAEGGWAKTAKGALRNWNMRSAT